MGIAVNVYVCWLPRRPLPTCQHINPNICWWCLRLGHTLWRHSHNLHHSLCCSQTPLTPNLPLQTWRNLAQLRIITGLGWQLKRTFHCILGQVNNRLSPDDMSPWGPPLLYQISRDTIKINQAPAICREYILSTHTCTQARDFLLENIEWRLT